MEFRKENHKIGIDYRAFRVEPETLDDEKRTVDVTFTTGARVKRMPWFGEPFYEELGTKRKHVRLERLNSGAPVLNAHRAYNLDDVIGAVVENSARMTEGVGKATIRLDDDRGEGPGGEDGFAEKVFRKIKRKTLNNVSIGYRVYKFEEAGKHEDGTKIMRAIDWEPFEISPVPIPADSGARVRGEEDSTNDCEFLLRETEEMKIEEQPTRGNNAPENKSEGATAPTPIDAEKVRQEAVKAERERSAEIAKACESVGLSREFADGLIDKGVNLDSARKLIIEEKAKLDKESQVRSTNVAVTRDENETRIQNAQGALLHRINPVVHTLDDGARAYRSLSLMDLAREFCEAHGIKTRGMDKMEIAKRAFHSTTDFPILLANTATKTLRSAYAEAPQTYQPIVRQTTLVDFKPVDRVQMGGSTLDLDEIGEGGEVKYGTVGEAKEPISLKSYAKAFAVTRQAIINDDLDALSRIPSIFGRKVRKKEADLVWGIITANAAMSDAVALFHADHFNLASSGAAISETTMGAARLAMRTQTDIDGDVVQVRPYFLAVPAALETVAQKFLFGVISATKDSDTNVFKNSMDLIVESRLDAASATAWYVFGSPSEIDLIELAYLQGEPGPALDTMEGFEIDGMKMKVRVDLGAKAIDWRGMYKNAGA